MFARRAHDSLGKLRRMRRGERYGNAFRLHGFGSAHRHRAMRIEQHAARFELRGDDA